MSQRLTLKIDMPVKLEKKDEVLSLIVGEVKMIIPKSGVVHDGMFDDDSIEGRMKTEVIFEIKHKKGEPFVMTAEHGEPITYNPPSFEFKEVELGDFMSDSSFYTQGDLFEEALNKVLDQKLSIGELDHLIVKDGVIWSDEEEQIAYEICIGSSNARDTATLKELIDNAIDHGTLRREFDSIKMKVYQYQSVIEGDVEGLSNISQKVFKTVEKNKKH